MNCSGGADRPACPEGPSTKRAGQASFLKEIFEMNVVGAGFVVHEGLVVQAGATNGAALVEEALEGGETALREGLPVAVTVEGALVRVEAERANLELVAGGAGETKAGLGEPTKSGAHGRAVVRLLSGGGGCGACSAGHEGLLPAVKWTQAQGIAFPETGWAGWRDTEG